MQGYALLISDPLSILSHELNEFANFTNTYPN
jgi:hypothetical protein